MDLKKMVDLGRFDGRPRYYYLRVVQADGHRAWSSPVWLDPAGVAALCVEPKDLAYDHAAGTLTVRPRNSGDADATAANRVYSSARSPDLSRHRFLGRSRGVAVWAEPIDDDTCTLHLVVASSQRPGSRGQFRCTGTLRLTGAKRYAVALDRRGVLRDDGKGALEWSAEYGLLFKQSQSRAGAVSPMALRVETNAETVATLQIAIDGKPCENVWIGSRKTPPGRPATLTLGGLARRSLAAKSSVAVARGRSAAVTIPNLPAPARYVVVLDPSGTVADFDRRNNTAALTVPAEPVVRDPWPDRRRDD